MGKDSAIEWTQHTFNPWWGCVKVAEGCKNCYAERTSHRFDFDVWGSDKPRRFLKPSYYKQPLQWNRKAEKNGVIERVFCGSMCDIFEYRDDIAGDMMDEYRGKLWDIVGKTPNLEWQLLTKRIQNARGMLPPEWLEKGGWPKNARLGISVSTHADYEKNFPVLAEIGVPNFVSMEPLLTAIHIIPYHDRLPDWVIVGGESGPNARPMNPYHVHAIKDHCLKLYIPFFFKQWGEWLPFAPGFGVAPLGPGGGSICP